MSVDPARTRVLAVGIEHYAGPFGKLLGAADAARRFIRWALDCGVPPNQITLACNDTDTDGDLPDAIRRLDPLVELLRNEIVGLASDPRSLLLVYWCGHGLVDSKRERVLLAADTTEQDMRVIGVDDALVYLASSQVTTLGRQLLLIDSCANFGGYYSSALSRSTFPPAEGRELEQFALFAAGQGQTAGYSAALRDTVFSDTALGWLEEHARELPPDSMELWEVVRARFADHVRQTPVYWSLNTATGRQQRYGVIPVPAVTHAAALDSQLTVSQLHRMAERAVMLWSRLGEPARELLAEALGADSGAAGLDDERLRDAIRAGCARADLPAILNAVRAGELDECELLAVHDLDRAWWRQRRIAPVLQLLRDVTSQQMREAFACAWQEGAPEMPPNLDAALDVAAEHETKDDRSPLLRLVARLAHVTGTGVADDWYGLTADRLNALRAWARKERCEPAFLVVDLHNPDPVDTGWAGSVDGYLRLPGGPWTKSTVTCSSTRAGVHAAIAEHLHAAYERGVASLRIGLIVSRRTFDELPESWEFGERYELPTALWREYPTVLHCAERLSVAKLRNLWHKNATAILGRVENDPPDVLWLDAQHRDDPVAVRAAVLGGSQACCGFGFTPGAFCGDHGRDPLVVALVSGAPFVLWTDDEPTDWQALRIEIAALVAGGRFAEVPDRLHAARLAGVGRLRSLRVVWDEPDGMPEQAQLAGLSTGARDA